MLVGNSANEGGIANINNGTFFSQFFGQGVTSEALNLVMTCSSRNTARARRITGVKTWRYRYFGDWPNSYIADGAGAYHGSDIPMVFGTTEHYRNVSDTTVEAKVVKSMMGAWAAFAKDPERGLLGLGWPEFNESSEWLYLMICTLLIFVIAPSLVRLGYRNQSAISFADNGVYDQGCEVVGL